MDLGLLIEQIRQGDETAGAVLVSIVAPRLLGYADLIAPDLPEVDRDLAVEKAIETAIRKIDRYDESRGTFPAWVRPFVKHAVDDWRRRHTRGAPSELAVEPEQPAEPRTPDMVSFCARRLVLRDAVDNQEAPFLTVGTVTQMPRWEQLSGSVATGPSGGLSEPKRGDRATTIISRRRREKTCRSLANPCVATISGEGASPMSGVLEPPDDADELVNPGAVAIAAIVLSESEPNQLLIRLRFVEDLTHAQIAERLNVNEAASRKRLERLLARLRSTAAGDPDLSGYLKGEEDDQP